MSPSNSLMSCRTAAHFRGGQCLSPTFSSVKPLLWKCCNGHTFTARWNSVIVDRQWCAICDVAKFRRVKTEGSRYTIDEMKDLAKLKGGECLSTEYKNLSTRLRWRCAAGHTWDAMPKTVRDSHWCLRCDSLKVENEALAAAHENSITRVFRDWKGKNSVWQCRFHHRFTESDSVMARLKRSPLLQCCTNAIYDGLGCSIDRFLEKLYDAAICGDIDEEVREWRAEERRIAEERQKRLESDSCCSSDSSCCCTDYSDRGFNTYCSCNGYR